MHKLTNNHPRLLAMLLFSTLIPANLSADDAVAANFIHFSAAYDEDCEEKGGKRVFVENQHDKRIIDVHIDRYFSGVRQGGRSMFALAPKTSQAMGCNQVFDTKQSWTLIKASFIEADHALSRYGEIKDNNAAQ